MGLKLDMVVEGKEMELEVRYRRERDGVGLKLEVRRERDGVCLKLDMVVERGKEMENGLEVRYGGRRVKRWSGLEVRYGGRRERDGVGLKLDMVVEGKEMEWA